MEVVEKILGNTSLWEVMVLFVVGYLCTQPGFIERISKLKFGTFEIELKELREEVKKGNEKIGELELELENERRLFEDILDGFDSDAPVSDLASARQAIKAQARNLSEVDVLKSYLNTNASPEQVYVAAVSIREKRPVSLLPELIDFIGEVTQDSKLCGFRLNTIWTLVSGLHRTLISSIRDGVEPIPSHEVLKYARKVLKELDVHPKVKLDRPDDPMKGIRGPVKHALSWVDKGLTKVAENKT